MRLLERQRAQTVVKPLGGLKSMVPEGGLAGRRRAAAVCTARFLLSLDATLVSNDQAFNQVGRLRWEDWSS